MVPDENEISDRTDGNVAAMTKRHDHERDDAPLVFNSGLRGSYGVVMIALSQPSRVYTVSRQVVNNEMSISGQYFNCVL